MSGKDKTGGDNAEANADANADADADADAAATDEQAADAGESGKASPAAGLVIDTSATATMPPPDTAAHTPLMLLAKARADAKAAAEAAAAAHKAADKAQASASAGELAQLQQAAAEAAELARQLDTEAMALEVASAADSTSPHRTPNPSSRTPKAHMAHSEHTRQDAIARERQAKRALARRLGDLYNKPHVVIGVFGGAGGLHAMLVRESY